MRQCLLAITGNNMQYREKQNATNIYIYLAKAPLAGLNPENTGVKIEAYT